MPFRFLLFAAALLLPSASSAGDGKAFRPPPVAARTLPPDPALPGAVSGPRVRPDPEPGSDAMILPALRETLDLEIRDDFGIDCFAVHPEGPSLPDAGGAGTEADTPAPAPAPCDSGEK